MNQYHCRPSVVVGPFRLAYAQLVRCQPSIAFSPQRLPARRVCTSYNGQNSGESRDDLTDCA
jgi:hypothetical protein